MTRKKVAARRKAAAAPRLASQFDAWRAGLPPFVAEHELGHASVAWSLGVRFIRVMSGTPDCMAAGVAGRVEYPNPVAASIGSRLMLGAAGYIAQWMMAGEPSGDDAIAAVLLGSRPLPGGCTDLRFNVQTAAVQGWQPRDCVAFWRDAEDAVRALRPVIGQVAPALSAGGELRWDEFAGLAAAAMTGHPQPVFFARAAG